MSKLTSILISTYTFLNLMQCLSFIVQIEPCFVLCDAINQSNNSDKHYLCKTFKSFDKYTKLENKIWLKPAKYQRHTKNAVDSTTKDTALLCRHVK